MSCAIACTGSASGLSIIGAWSPRSGCSLSSSSAGPGITLHGRLSSQFTVPDIESEQAQHLLEKQFPEVAGGTARSVFAAPERTQLTDSPAEAGSHASLRAAAAVPGVVEVSDAAVAGTISPDKTIAYADVIFSRPAAQVPAAQRGAIMRAVAPARRADLEVEFGGTAETSGVDVGGVSEIVGIVLAFVILAVALSSLVAAGMSLATALIGVGIGVLGVEFVDRFIQLTTTATVLATMLGLEMGIDYALFIVARHRDRGSRGSGCRAAQPEMGDTDTSHLWCQWVNAATSSAVLARCRAVTIAKTAVSKSSAAGFQWCSPRISELTS